MGLANDARRWSTGNLSTASHPAAAEVLAKCADAIEAKDAEIARLTADLSALRAAVGEIPQEIHHAGCAKAAHVGTDAVFTTPCTCWAWEANAARANARKLAGLK